MKKYIPLLEDKINAKDLSKIIRDFFKEKGYEKAGKQVKTGVGYIYDEIPGYRITYEKGINNRYMVIQHNLSKKDIKELFSLLNKNKIKYSGGDRGNDILINSKKNKHIIGL